MNHEEKRRLSRDLTVTAHDRLDEFADEHNVSVTAFLEAFALALDPALDLQPEFLQGVITEAKALSKQRRRRARD